MSNEPEISVVLPVYNCRRYVREALQSVLDQTFSSFEVLAINDGSTDDGGAVLRRMATRDARVEVIETGNRGLIATLNTGLERARARLIARMDADDVCTPDRFERQIEYLNSRPECIAVGCHATIVDPEGSPIMPGFTNTSHEEVEGAYLRGSGGMPHSGAMYLRESALKIGGYREEFHGAEDVDFFLRLADLGELHSIPDVMLKVRFHLQSESRTKGEMQRRSAMAAVMDTYRRRGMEIPEGGLKLNPVLAKDSKGEHHRKWALWALRAGNRRTAMKHAVKGVFLEPGNFESWRMLKWAVRGR